jgi:type II secretory pathway pseudopilin PulG
MIELLIAMGIILIIAAMGYWLLPGLIGNQNRARAVDQLTEWFLTAKMRARRDGLATGLRLYYVDPSTGAHTPVDGVTVTTANTVAYVQQPDPLTGGTCQGTCDASNNLTPGTASTFVLFSTVDFIGPAPIAATGGEPTDYSQALVQPGDYLEVNYCGSVHQITHVTYNASATPPTTTLTLATAVPGFGSMTPGATPTPYPTTYRILRQPRLLVGEEMKALGAELVIDFTALTSPALSSKCLNVPFRTVVVNPNATPPTTLTYSEIVFSPSGGVIGQGTTSGKIVLWISDNAVTNTPAPPALVAINTRTGFIGAYEVDLTSATDPYSFTEDGRSGGF